VMKWSPIPLLWYIRRVIKQVIRSSDIVWFRPSIDLKVFIYKKVKTKKRNKERKKE